MAKPRRSTAEAFYDVFSDFPISEQAIALRICEELHRQAVKLARAEVRKTDTVASAVGECPKCGGRGSVRSDISSSVRERCDVCGGTGKVLSQGSLLDDPATESGNGGTKLQ